MLAFILTNSAVFGLDESGARWEFITNMTSDRTAFGCGFVKTSIGRELLVAGQFNSNYV